VSYQ